MISQQEFWGSHIRKMCVYTLISVYLANIQKNNPKSLMYKIVSLDLTIGIRVDLYKIQDYHGYFN